MKKIGLVIAAIVLNANILSAQCAFKGHFKEKAQKINLEINLYEEDIIAPGMDMFGPMNGYINGNVYGLWVVTSAKVIDEKNAFLKLSNDLGSETQSVELNIPNDSTLIFHLKDGVSIKRIEGKKLVKIPSQLVFTKQKTTSSK